MVQYESANLIKIGMIVDTFFSIFCERNHVKTFNSFRFVTSSSGLVDIAEAAKMCVCI